jgi:phage terminase large subunit
VRRLRHLLGKWAQAEGVVYEGFDSTVHIVDRFHLPVDWDRVWSIDFGYTVPACWQQWVVDPDGRLILDKEIYHTKKLIKDLAAMIRDATASDPRPVDFVADPEDARGRAELEHELGVYSTPADKTVIEGINDVETRLRVAGDGCPRLTLFRDTLQHDPDPDLLATGSPTHTASEFDSYIWKVTPQGAKKDEPVKKDDHGMDAMRYVTRWANARGVSSGSSYSANFTPDAGYKAAFR